MVAKLHEFFIWTFTGAKFLNLYDSDHICTNKARGEKRIFGKQILICTPVKSGLWAKRRTAERILPPQKKSDV